MYSSMHNYAEHTLSVSVTMVLDVTRYSVNCHIHFMAILHCAGLPEYHEYQVSTLIDLEMQAVCE